MMEKIWKRAWEEVFFWHCFSRTPIKGWLADTEVLSSITSVKVYNENDVEQTSMVVSSEIDAADSTKVKYMLGGGVAGKGYTVVFRVVTSNDQKLEDKITLEVIE
jgi:hypothetical protein